jgi:hypothetical protein
VKNECETSEKHRIEAKDEGAAARAWGLPGLLFARRGAAEFELCLQFGNLFAKRGDLVL